MKQSVAFLGNLSPTHKLTNVDDIAAFTLGIIERLATPLHPITNELIITVLLLTWDGNSEYRPFPCKALHEFDKVPAPVLALWVYVSLSETDNVVGHIAVATATASILELTIEKNEDSISVVSAICRPRGLRS
jgi:hypothetical protein